jgi:large subunit ribosomal protein L10
LNREEKEKIVSDLSKKLEGFQAVVVTYYRGLNVEQMNSLRQRLREEKIFYRVVKNTLMKLAARGTDLEKLNDYFEGPMAVAISFGDPVILAKILSDFIKTQPSLEIKAGLIQGKVALPEEVRALATMPSRQILFAQILGGIQMAGGQVGGALYTILQKILGVIQARVDQLSESSAPKV